MLYEIPAKRVLVSLAEFSHGVSIHNATEVSGIALVCTNWTHSWEHTCCLQFPNPPPPPSPHQHTCPRLLHFLSLTSDPSLWRHWWMLWHGHLCWKLKFSRLSWINFLLGIYRCESVIIFNNDSLIVHKYFHFDHFLIRLVHQIFFWLLNLYTNIVLSTFCSLITNNKDLRIRM